LRRHGSAFIVRNGRLSRGAQSTDRPQPMGKSWGVCCRLFESLSHALQAKHQRLTLARVKLLQSRYTTKDRGESLLTFLDIVLGGCCGLEFVNGGPNVPPFPTCQSSAQDARECHASRARAASSRERVRSRRASSRSSGMVILTNSLAQAGNR
jgi:hypothetical protein